MCSLCKNPLFFSYTQLYLPWRKDLHANNMIFHFSSIFCPNSIIIFAIITDTVLSTATIDVTSNTQTSTHQDRNLAPAAMVVRIATSLYNHEMNWTSSCNHIPGNSNVPDFPNQLSFTIDQTVSEHHMTTSVLFMY